MVECSHFDRSVKICSAFLDSRNETLPNRPSISSKSSPWSCQECGDVSHPWLCLGCGAVLCGRYVKGHALAHYYDKNHCMSLQCYSMEIYCYACDESVFGDTMDLRVMGIQRTLSGINSTHSSLYDGEDEADLATEVEDDSSSFSISDRSLYADEDSRSVPEDLPNFSNAGSLVGGRSLRPRKRRLLSISRQSSPFPASKARYGYSDEVRWRGLRNLGNTCFMNSVLQALSVTDIFRNYLTKLPMLEPDDDVIDMTHIPLAPRYNTRRAASNISVAQSKNTIFLAEELRKVLLSLSDLSKTIPVAPDEFFQAVWKMSPRFRGFHQQDAHEFLRCAMDRLHVELRKCRIPESADNWLTSQCGSSPSPSDSAVTRIFEGSLLSQVVCLTCHTASNKQETFMDLSLDIADPVKGGIVRLQDCIHRFFAKEELEQCEQYMCGSCMDKRPSTKQLMLSVLPTVLCLHLKRFRWTSTSRGKIDAMVEFPLEGLDISPFMTASSQRENQRSNLYDLSCVVVHHGGGVASGHYSAYGRRNDCWYHFNDSVVRECSEQTVLKQKAYLLFYTRSLVSQ